MLISTSPISICSLSIAVGVVFSAAQAFAQDEVDDGDTAAPLRAAPAEVPAENEGGAEGEGGKPPAAAVAEAGGRIEAIVRGLFVEMKAGPGYMLLSADAGGDTFNGDVEGSEELGIGGIVHLGAGYDVFTSDFLDVDVSVQGGALMSDGGRADKVRDLSVAFVALKAEVAFAISDRLDFLAGGGGGVAFSDNAVESSLVGGMLLVTAGIEYYVHVRHFSIGLELSTLLPVVGSDADAPTFSPGGARLFMALSPMVKYTF